MTIHRRQLLVFGAAIAVPWTSVRAQVAEQLQDVEATLPWPRAGEALTALAKIALADWQTRSPEFAAGIGRLVPAVEFLTTRWRQTRGPVPKMYIESLEADADGLRTVYAATNLTDPLRRLFAAVVTDVEVKAQHCAKSTRGWAELIEVRVNTLGADGKTVSGQEVWYCPRGWAAVASRWLRFRQVSSPAVGRLPPGVYLIRTGSASGAATPVRVGGDGGSTATVDVVVK